MSSVEELAARVEQQQEQIETLQRIVEQQREADGWYDTPDFSRRGVLAAAAALGVPATLGRATAQSSDPGAACEHLGDHDWSGYGGFNASGLTFVDGADLGTVQQGTHGIKADANGNLVKINPDGSTTQLGSGASPWSDSGTDNASGGDVYQLPQTSDGIDVGTVETDELSGVADTIVSTSSELESAFNNLSAGDHVLVEQPDTPYRHSQWLDIDVSNVTITFESRKAKNGDAITKVADGANVGGIRVGYNAAVEEITIQGHGHDGNDANQNSTVKNLSALRAGTNGNQVTDLTYERFYHTRTSPWHEHNSGGSGIAMDLVDDYEIRRGFFYDIGDRCIKTGGTQGRIYDCHCKDGFDRMVATDVGSGADDLHVEGCTAERISAGTAFKPSNPGGSASNIHVQDCTGFEVSDSVCDVGDGAEDVTFENVTAYSTGGTPFQTGASTNTGSGITYRDCTAISPDSNSAGHGFRHRSDITDVVVENLTVRGGYFRGMTVISPNITIRDADIENTYNVNGVYLGATASIDGLTVRSSDFTVTSSASDARIRNAEVSGAISDSGTRTRINGQVELSAAPTGSNYTVADAGLRILDTSVSPPNVYYVLKDGSVTGAT